MTDLTGQTIRGYQFKECIASGGFGAIYRPGQLTVDRPVAIKVILPHYVDRPDFVHRFESEARLIARLEHACIVPLIDFWRDDSGAYLVMRYLPGGTLAQMLQKGGLSLDILTPVFSRIADALDYAHQHGGIHRDLKPGNVLLDAQGTAYLGNFGWPLFSNI